MGPLLLLALACRSPSPPAGGEWVAFSGAPSPSGLPYTMVQVGPGSFQMEGQGVTSHEVRISRAFYLGSTEVTQALWFAVMGTRPAAHGACDACPVERVSWLDAVAFCNRLSEKLSLTPVYRVDGERVAWRAGPGFRLPTDAEWAWAFHENGVGPVDEVAWYGGNSRDASHPVATRAPGRLGLFDMAGNVREWVWDPWSALGPGRARDPRGPAAGTYRVVRGGAWDSFPEEVLAGDRDGTWPAYVDEAQGFRLAWGR